MRPECILDIEDMQRRRTVAELDRWIAEQCEKFRVSSEAKSYFRAHRGLTKQLIEELIPLVRFAQAKYGRDSDAEVEPVIGNQSYDALIFDESGEYKVETTLAIDGYQEHHRNLILDRDRTVPAWGEIVVEGNRHQGYEYAVESGGGTDTQIYGGFIRRIRSAYESKIGRVYEGVRTLVIGFEDFLAFSDEYDVDTFREMLAEFETNYKGPFQSIWIVGVSGNFHARFSAN